MAADDAGISDRLARVMADPGVPEAVRSALATGAKLQDLCLTAHGQWRFDGDLVQHPRVQELFFRGVRQTPAGTWLVEVGRYTYPIRVESTGWFVRSVSPRLRDGRLAGGERVRLRWAEAVTDGDTWLAVGVGAGRRARLVGAAYHDVLARLDVGPDGWVVHAAGRRFPLSEQPP